MTDVYLSYAPDDADRAELFGWALEERGWSVHTRRPAGPAMRLPAEVEAALEAAGCVVVLWSRASRYDRWVRREALWGRDAGKLVHVLLEDTRPSYEHRAAEVHDLGGWEPGAPHHGLAGLIIVLEGALRLGPAAYHLAVRNRLLAAIAGAVRAHHRSRRLSRRRLLWQIRSAVAAVRHRRPPAPVPAGEAPRRPAPAPERPARRRPWWRRLFGL